MSGGAADTAWVDALLFPDGQRLLAELEREPLTAAHELSLITALRRRYPAPLVAAAVTQAVLRRRAMSKFANAGQMYFTEAGLEQASSERMARHHAARLAPFERVMDLCTGIGGDLIALAGRAMPDSAGPVVGVDRDPVHARLAALNAAANGVGRMARVVCADVRDVRLDGLDAVFVDPARRSADRRLPAGASEPSLAWCLALTDRVPAVGIKAGPALPLELVPNGWEVEFVSERRELKEAVLWSPAVATTTRRATVLPYEHTLVQETITAVAPLDVRPPGAFLLDPDPAVTRAGLVNELGVALSQTGVCWKIDERIAFLSSHEPMRTSFGRLLRVEASMPWNLTRLREALRALKVGSVDIRKRGSAVDVDELQRKLRLTGERSATVVLTRAADQPWALVCVEPEVAA